MPKDMEPQKFCYRLHRLQLEDYIESDHRAPDGFILRGSHGSVVIEQKDIEHLKVLINHYQGNRNVSVSEEPIIWTKKFGNLEVRVVREYDEYGGSSLDYTLKAADLNGSQLQHLRDLADWLEEELEV